MNFLLFTLFLFSTCFAADFELSGEYSVMPEESTLKVNSGLEEHGGGSIVKLSINYKFENNLLLGLGVGKLEKSYIYNNKSNNYSSELAFKYLNVGYSFERERSFLQVLKCLRASL